MKSTRSTHEFQLIAGRIIPQSRSKLSSSTVETNLEHDLAISRAHSKHCSSLVETYLEQGETILKHSRILNRARSKISSITVRNYVEHGRKIPRAPSVHTSSAVETYFMLCLIILRRRSMHASNTVRKISSKIKKTISMHEIQLIARSEHSSITGEAYLEHGRNIPLA